jgi:hypothetical protein
MTQNQNSDTQPITEKHSYKRLITITTILVGIWGSVSTAAHFIGYSFLQGRIAGHGLGEHELTLSSFESVMQAAYSTKYMFEEFSESVISFLQMGFWGLVFTAIILGLIVAICREFSKKIEQSKVFNNLNTSSNLIPSWLKKTILYPMVSMYALVLFMLSIPLILYFIWAILTLSHSIGFDKGKKDIAVQQCVDISTLENKKGNVTSCSLFYDAKKQLYTGKIIFSNKVIRPPVIKIVDHHGLLSLKMLLIVNYLSYLDIYGRSPEVKPS